MLDLAGTDGVAGAERIAMGQFAGEDVSDDLHVAMGMGAEAGSRSHAVLVDHPQAAKAHEAWIVVGVETKGVKGVQPAVIGVAAFGGTAQGKHGKNLASVTALPRIASVVEISNKTGNNALLVNSAATTNRIHSLRKKMQTAPVLLVICGRRLPPASKSRPGALISRLPIQNHMASGTRPWARQDSRRHWGMSRTKGRRPPGLPDWTLPERCSFRHSR